VIAGILLAAGESRRFGSCKLLAPKGGHPLVYYAVYAALESQLGVLHVVLPPRGLAKEIREWFPDASRLRMHRNPRPARGIASSLRTGFESVDDSADGAMILLADMPWVGVHLIDKLMATFEMNPGIVVAGCGDTHAHPRIIPRSLFGEFRALRDGHSGRKIIDRHTNELIVVPGGDPKQFDDVDYPEDIDPEPDRSGPECC